MVESVPELPANFDLGALGKTMLEAAEGARIGVTVTLVDESRPRICRASSSGSASERAASWGTSRTS